MRSSIAVAFLVGSALQGAVALGASRSSSLLAPKTKAVNQTKANAAPDADVKGMTAHLEQVVTGLTKIVAASKTKPQEGSKFLTIVEPFVQSVSGVLKKVKTDANLTKTEKVEMLKNAESALTGLMKDMAKRQTELSEESEAEKESLLLGVLMARHGRPEKEQMEVLESDEFKDLAVVKQILAHRDASKGLAEQVAEYMDKNGKGSSMAAGKNMTKAQAVTAIVSKLETQVAKMEHNLKESEENHKKQMAKLAEAEKKDEKSALSINGTDAQKQKRLKHAKAVAQRMSKRLDRDFQKFHAINAKDAKTLKSAIASMKKGDMTALAVARKALMDSLNRMKANSGEFLHFLQISMYTSAKDGSCPYCKAQCLEKCHDGGESFLQCMGTCASVGN